ncbi:hypothetical protein ACTMU2_40250 [Cupriavidus basilensis]
MPMHRLRARSARGVHGCDAAAVAGRPRCWLQRAAGGNIDVYALGNWEAPFGIVVQLDRLGALMLALSAPRWRPRRWPRQARPRARGAISTRCSSSSSWA